MPQGGGGGGFWAFGQFFGEDAQSSNRQLFPVRRGDLAETVSTNGSVRYATRETLTFSASGTVGEVFVAEGQSVGKGQEIAALDASAVATLERAVREAEVAVRSAEERLSDLAKPADALALALAEAEVENARAGLRDAERTSDASLRRAVADAASAMNAAQEKVDSVSKPSALAVALAGAEVAQAKAALRTAEDALGDVSGGAAKARAEQNLQIAQISLSNGRTDLRVAELTRDDKVAAAKTALDDGDVKYLSTVTGWVGVKLTAEQALKTPDDLLASWGVTYDGLVNAAADSALMADNPATPWNEQVLYLWTHLMPARVVGGCSTPVSAATRCMQGEVEAAWKASTAARTAFDSTSTQQTNAVNAAKNAVTKAEDGLAAAKRAMDDLAGAVTAQARAADVAVAKARLADGDKKIADASRVDAAAVASAKAQLDEARVRLAAASDALGRADRTRESSIAVAKGRLTSAEEKLADMRQIGKDDLALALARAQAAESKARFETARDVLGGAVLRAPFAGVVSAVGVEAGQAVSPLTAVAEVVDSSVLEVDAVVDEIDVLSLRVGAEAAITMDALSGWTLRGTVSEIGGAANSQNGVVSYPIKVRIEVPQGLELREGLSATASVVVRFETNALLVPVQAVGGPISRPTVKAMRGGTEQTVEVELGISDESWVVVSRGLEEGDQVVIETSATASADLRLQRQGAFGQGQTIIPGGGQGQGGPQFFTGPGGQWQGGAGQPQGGGQRQQGR